MVTYFLVDPPNSSSQYNVCREYQGTYYFSTFKSNYFAHTIYILSPVESPLTPNMNSYNACPSTSRQMSNIRHSQHGKPKPNFRPNVVMAENQKKSYNYMASPNYLQYENTYQKFKNICHNKDVTNFPNNSLNQDQRIEYRNHDHNGAGYISNDRFPEIEIKAENTMQSSDDEGGFRQNIHFAKNQFNHLNSINGCNGIDENLGYNFKELEPLLHGGHNRDIANNRQNYEPPHYANPGAMISVQNGQKAIEPQKSSHYHSNRLNQHQHHQYQHQHKPSHQHQHQYQHGHSPYRKVPPIPQPYTKPLPKLPTNIGMF